VTDAPVPDPRVSVAVITHLRPEELARTLDRLLALPEQPRVVVVDNGADPATEKVVAERPTVGLLAPGRNLGAAGRTLAARALQTPYVAFCDDDTWWEPGSLRAAADAFDDAPRLAVVTARILVEPGAREDPVVAELETSPLPRDADIPGLPIISFLAGASVVRREAFLGVGGFEPRLLIGGEEELCAMDLQRQGWALAYLPYLTVHHHPSTARDPHLRRRQGIRNTLWTTWLRRPLPSALRRTAMLARGFPLDVHTARAVGDALRGLPWVLRARDPLPPELDERHRSFDLLQTRSKARRYVS